MIRRATIGDLDSIAHILDTQWAGYGFVTKATLATEIGKGRVFICLNDDEIIGIRIGTRRLWNLFVVSKWRGKGVGKKLMEAHEPDWIRVKCNPVGHLSKKQLAEFIDPRPFYESLGYEECAEDYARNFYAGEKDGKKLHQLIGKKKHIKLYRNKRTTLLWCSAGRAGSEHPQAFL